MWSAAVLTGGRSARMGRDKALLLVDGQPMAARAAAAAAAAGAAEVFTVGGDVGALAALGLDARAEPWPGEGPLAGLLAALDAAREAVVMVLACDLVTPDPGSIATVVAALVAAPGDVAAAAPVSGDRVQVLHAAYRPARCAPLRAAFDAGERAVHRALATIRWLPVSGIHEPALADADTPDRLPSVPCWPSGERGGPDLTVPEVDVEELARARAAGAPLIDVREPDEYAEFHVPGAALLPLAEVPERLDELPAREGEPVFVICGSGGRSRRAAEYLIANGIDAVNVAGGSRAWLEAGHPVVTGPEPG